MQESVIQFRGTIYEKGYGLVPQKVMRDSDLSPIAKSIYAYICSFAGVGEDGERSAFPGVELMKKELGIKTNGAYYKHRKQLIDKGYISIEKKRKKGQRFANNLYFVEAVPVEKVTEKPLSEKQTTVPLSVSPTTEIPTTVKQTTIINSSLSLTDFKKEEEEYYIDNIFYMQLKKFLKEKDVNLETIKKIIELLHQNNIKDFHMQAIQEQYEQMMKKPDRIYNFPVYFVNGVKEIIKYDDAKQAYQKELKQKRANRDTSVYYDWLS